MIKKMMMVMIAVMCMISIVSVANAAFLYTYEDTGAQTLKLVSSDDTIFVVKMSDEDGPDYTSWEFGIYSTTPSAEGHVVNPENMLSLFDMDSVVPMTTLQFNESGTPDVYNVTNLGTRETAVLDGIFGVYFKYTDDDGDHILYSQNFLNDPEADWFEICDAGGDSSLVRVDGEEINLMFAGATPADPTGANTVPITGAHFLLGSGIVGLLAIRKRD